MAQHSDRVRLRRLMASLVDLGLGVGLGLGLSETRVGYFFASRAVVMLRIGAPNTIWKGSIPMILGILGPFVYALPFAMLLILLCAPLFGRSPGLALAGLRIVSSDNGMASRQQRWSRALTAATPCWGLVAALLAGSWILAIVFAAAGVVLTGSVMLSWIAPVRPVYEVMSGTSVVKTFLPTRYLPP